VALPSAGISEPRATYEGDVQAILKALHSVQLGITSLILHSYAGIPGRDAASRYLADSSTSNVKLERIVFVAAIDRFNPADDHFFWDDIIRHEDGYNYLLDPASNTFSDLTTEQAQPYVDAVVPQTLPLPTETDFWGPSPSEKWRELERAYLVCLNDKMLKPEYEQQQAEKVGGKVVTKDWDHCPMISHPEELAEVIQEIVR
jgi:pimeloyl-ACP methyl ester carboxylesterase